MITTNQSKKFYLTFLSVISAFAVVTLHTNGCFWSFSYERYWITANIIECVMYFAVPVFFMITGVTLLDYREKYTTSVYLKKRTEKTVIPFLIWSLIGVIYHLLANNLELNQLNFINLVEKIFNTQIIDIYWFFIPLFVVYLTIPVISAIPKDKKVEVFKYIILISFVLNCLFPFFEKAKLINYNDSLQLNIAQNYLIYVYLGYVLNHTNFTKKQRFSIYFIAIISLLIMIAGTQFLSFEHGFIDKTFKGYHNFPCMFYSIGIFVLIKELSKRLKNEKFIRFINYLGGYTFSTYLTHWFIIRIIRKIFAINTLSIYYRLLGPVLIILINIIISEIIRKIPLGKKILP